MKTLQQLPLKNKYLNKHFQKFIYLGKKNGFASIFIMIESVIWVSSKRDTKLDHAFVVLHVTPLLVLYYHGKLK